MRIIELMMKPICADLITTFGNEARYWWLPVLVLYIIFAVIVAVKGRHGTIEKKMMVIIGVTALVIALVLIIFRDMITAFLQNI